MKRIISTLMAAVLLSLMLTMFSGCGMFTNYKAIAEQALEDKYGEEFVCHSTWDEKSTDFSAEMSPAYDEGIKFYAGIWLEDKSSYYDKYTEAIVEKQIADIVYEEMTEVWNDFCVDVTINSQGICILNKEDITVESYYNKVDYNMEYDIHINIAIDKDSMINCDYYLEYEKLLAISETINVDDIYFCLYFVDKTAYSEYKDWFYSTYNINSGDFKYRDDYNNAIITHVNCITKEYSLNLDHYISQRSEVGGNI